MTTRFLLILLLLGAPALGCFGPSCTKIIFQRPCMQPVCRCTTVTCFRKYFLLPPPPPPPIFVQTVQRSCCTLTNFSCCRTFYGKK
ncbi:Protein CBG26446 [Caenorhabditis briggsae]|uniref:Protein CBG26446 n=2 Tax=Caenorhabditis briggsae TaxID=6238 RepID=B6IEY3_CAEBR|nr:Protein CBG26446 [Caenorhabditis briggsae]ULT96548.1 hypothetical protein L3Y34_004846 [Caenorhabditis briggsae]CAR98463.1 Protein CBG26446 [Caenorhabditis briggsae]